MKLAITADVHLRSKDKTPKRWIALENILNQLRSRKIKDLIIAGDLFDAESRNYSEFDKLCKNKKFKEIDIHIIPGNHDLGLKETNFVADNIHIYEQPAIVNQNDLKFLFVPYLPDKTMASVLADFAPKDSPWVLIGHGNWAETIRSINPTEPGIYMALSKKVVKEYQPSLTVLGHVHKKMDDHDYNVYYPGSPCGLDITETGRRSYLILDSDTLGIQRKEIETGVLYFDEDIVIYPIENEQKYWQKEAVKLKSKWNLKESEKEKAVIRINISGFSSNKRELKNYFDKEFKDFEGWKEKKIEMSNLNSSDNYELLKISEQVSKRINNLELPPKEGEPTNDQILYQAIKTIYDIN